MTKTVLCYGDSLTWGYSAETVGRHAYEDRWPSVLQKALGDRVRVIPEGLNGRTTAFDDHLADCDRNGARILPTILQSHNPLDLVIIMLGTNDMKPVRPLPPCRASAAWSSWCAIMPGGSTTRCPIS